MACTASRTCALTLRSRRSLRSLGRRRSGAPYLYVRATHGTWKHQWNLWPSYSLPLHSSRLRSLLQGASSPRSNLRVIGQFYSSLLACSCFYLVCLGVMHFAPSYSRASCSSRVATWARFAPVPLSNLLSSGPSSSGCMVLPFLYPLSGWRALAFPFSRCATNEP